MGCLYCLLTGLTLRLRLFCFCGDYGRLTCELGFKIGFWFKVCLVLALVGVLMVWCFSLLFTLKVGLIVSSVVLAGSSVLVLVLFVVWGVVVLGVILLCALVWCLG